jgi:5-methylcytosine-specific restriction endonuclease McrA
MKRIPLRRKAPLRTHTWLRRKVPLRTRSALRRLVALLRQRGPVELTCDYCGTIFHRFQRHRRHAKRAFCCRDCARQYRRREHSKNPKVPAPQHSRAWWRRLRAYVRARDGFRCVLCGISERELGCQLGVDHVYPRQAFKRAIEVYQQFGTAAFVSVCPRCHGRKTGGAEAAWLKGDALRLQIYVSAVV